MLTRHEAIDPGAEITGLRELRRSGLTREQCRHLMRMRERACRGGYREDGLGSVTGDVGFDRRLEFARWLYQHGRIAG